MEDIAAQSKPNPQACKSSSTHLSCRRMVWCAQYSNCLNLAIKLDWESFTCTECQAFTPLSLTPEQLQQDAHCCIALIHSIAKKRLTGKHLHGLLNHFEAEREQSVGHRFPRELGGFA